MRAAWQHARDVFRTDYREQIRLGIAVERGEEHPAARFDERCTRLDDARRIRHVFDKDKSKGCSPIHAVPRLGEGASGSPLKTPTTISRITGERRKTGFPNSSAA